MCARRACKHDEEHTHKYISLTGTTYERMVTNNPVFWRKKNIISNDTRLSCVYVQNTRDTNLELPSDTQPCVYVIANSCCFFKYTCTARQSSVTYTVWCRTPYDAWWNLRSITLLHTILAKSKHMWENAVLWGLQMYRSILIGFHTITYYDTITVLGITPAWS